VAITASHDLEARAPCDAVRSAYVHVPFCAARCGYCNFTVVAGRGDLVEAYLRAIEIELSQLKYPRPVDTLFFGGGTPTQLPPPVLARLMAITGRWFPSAPGAEISVEANPADVTEECAGVLARGGVTRVSLGAQSFRPEKLVLLERDHAPDDIVRAVELLRGRIASISLDLIFAAPGETLAQWRADLADALAAAPDHLSTYGLTIEKGAAFYGRLLRGELSPCEEEPQAAMYTTAIDTLSQAGFEQYDVSNFARPEHRCRHNLRYWAGEEYYAVGPGASRYVDASRQTNHRSTTTYLRRVFSGASPVAEYETLSAEDRARERLVFALRRTDGVKRTWFREQSGYSADELAGDVLRRFVQWGLLTDDGTTLRLTRRGLLVSDSMWPEILRR
jgi:oxygen-independent coproporphyrinogen-3 oxidase